jgi:hypothetical protein
MHKTAAYQPTTASHQLHALPVMARSGVATPIFILDVPTLSMHHAWFAVFMPTEMAYAPPVTMQLVPFPPDCNAAAMALTTMESFIMLPAPATEDGHVALAPPFHVPYESELVL